MTENEFSLILITATVVGGVMGVFIRHYSKLVLLIFICSCLLSGPILLSIFSPDGWNGETSFGQIIGVGIYLSFLILIAYVTSFGAIGWVVNRMTERNPTR